MPSLIYSPGIKVHIESSVMGKILDLSEDIVDAQIQLRENAPHTAFFTLQNAQRKYDGRFMPNDKISVQLKRLNWLQTMTGYINDSPMFQLWPGTMPFSATCTLKKPQFWYWDSSTSAAQTMVLNSLGENIDQRAQEGDFGLSRLIVDSMSQVMQWPKERIHIGQVPPNWFKFAQTVSDDIAADQAMYETIGGSYTAAGNTSGVQVNLPAASYGGYVIDADQARNASIIDATVATLDSRDFVHIMTLMCALDESSLYNLASPAVPGSEDLPHDKVQDPNYDSAGLFQQRLQYYGPVGKIMDPATATRAFATKLIAKLQGVRRLSSSSYGSTIQSVQGSAISDGSNYQRYLGPATAIYQKLAQLSTAVTGRTATTNSPIIDPAAGFVASGSQMAKVGMDLIAAHKTDPIIYVFGNDDPYDTPIDQVKHLDCSSLIDLCYYHTTGDALIKPRGSVASIAPLCKRISLDAARCIQGAVLIKLGGGDDHIGLSLGDGINHVAAHMPYSDPTKDVNVSPIDGNGFMFGGLLPGLDYSSSATTPIAKAALLAAGEQFKGYAPNLTDVNDPNLSSVTQTGNDGSPFESLINGILGVNRTSSDLVGNTLGGPATLINDAPFLPWLQSVVNSSMRSFCSAPNGDFIAWFPDYFGSWGTAGIMKIQYIELLNFDLKWSDQEMVTHQFVLGNLGASILDPITGGISSNSPVQDLVHLALGTAGIASMDYPEIFQAIYGKTVPPEFIKSFLARFGARPDVQQMPNIPHGAAEFFMALYLFIQRWAGQFSTTIPITFMPELFPGMLMQIPELGVQVYVRGVTHRISFGDGGGFYTDVDVCAPSNIGSADRSDPLALLPHAAGKVA